MAAISQTIFSNAFSWMKTSVFWIIFYWIMFHYGLSNWQYDIIGLDNGLAPNRRQAIIWINDDLVYWRIYASLGLNEFTGPLGTNFIEIQIIIQRFLFDAFENVVFKLAVNLSWPQRVNNWDPCSYQCFAPGVPIRVCLGTTQERGQLVRIDILQ